MKEIEKRITFIADLIDENGECHKVSANECITEKYYSIKKLNRKVCYMDLINAQAYICSSSTDIKLFGILFSNLDEDNGFYINITKRAKELEISRQKLSNILSKAVECGFLYKYETGHYMVNPYIIRGTKFGNNAKFESVQRKWDDLTILL